MHIKCCIISCFSDINAYVTCNITCGGLLPFTTTCSDNCKLSTGSDGIPNIIVKGCHKCFAIVLQKVFNSDGMASFQKNGYARLS